MKHQLFQYASTQAPRRYTNQRQGQRLSKGPPLFIVCQVCLLVWILPSVIQPFEPMLPFLVPLGLSVESTVLSRVAQFAAAATLS